MVQRLGMQALSRLCYPAECKMFQKAKGLGDDTYMCINVMQLGQSCNDSDLKL